MMLEEALQRRIEWQERYISYLEEQIKEQEEEDQESGVDNAFYRGMLKGMKIEAKSHLRDLKSLLTQAELDKPFTEAV